MTLSTPTLVLYTADSWQSACPTLRVVGPAHHAGLNVIHGNNWDYKRGLQNFTVEPIATAQVVVIQRDFPRNTQAYEQVLAAARQHHKPIVYELDDMLLSLPDDHPSYEFYTQHRLALYHAIFQAQMVTTSTAPLQRYLQQFHPQVRLLPNYLNPTLWTLQPPRPAEAGRPVSIGYMGGLTHQPDLALIALVLIRLAQRYGPRIEFRFWGTTPPPPALVALATVKWDPISINDYAAFAQYWQAQQCDIVVAPLVDNFFNRCKSAIKFLEYTVLGAAGVYSRVVPYEAVIRDGENGLLANTEAEWDAALTRLIEDEALRLRLAQGAQATVQRDWWLPPHAAQWAEAYAAALTPAPVAPVGEEPELAQMVRAFWDERAAIRTAVEAQLAGRIYNLEQELVRIKDNPFYPWMQGLHRGYQRLFPPNTGRDQLMQALFTAGNTWQKAGWRAAFQKLWAVVQLQGSLTLQRFSNRKPPSGPYEAWIEAHEPTAAQLAQQRATVARWPRRPLISIVTPVFNPPLAAFRDTMAAVQAQTYPHWEWCIAEAGSQADLWALLQTSAQQDARLRLKRLENNLGISGNANAALAMAQGEFVLLLDHDDLLAPEALFRLVEALNAKPDADLVYFDEDKVSEDGSQRLAPWFKPGAWSPDLLLSTNYWMHCAVRRELLTAVGGFDAAMDGAQDWDLALRLSERTPQVVHLPRVLYHWRQVPGSAARDANAKPWAFAAQEGCLRAHLQRLTNVAPALSFPQLGQVRIQWPVSGAKVSIIIPSKDKVSFLRPCLTSILTQTAYLNFEIIVVDTGSTEAVTQRYYAQLALEPRVKIVHLPPPFNYSLANNFGATHATGELLLFLNNDIEVHTADWLTELVGWAERPGVGVVGCKLMRPDGTVQHAGLIMGMAGHGSHVFDGGPDNVYGPFGSSEWYRDYQAVTGACMMLRRAVFVELNGFDETYQVCYSDIEICLRANALGYRTVYTPFAKLLHHEGASRGFGVPLPDVLRAYLQMLTLVQDGDPYFSPHLSYQDRSPAVAPPAPAPRADQLTEILKAFDLLAPHKKLGLGTDDGAWVSAPVAGPIEKRVLFVTHELSLSGAPLILYKLALGWLQAGYAVAVISPFEGEMRAMYEAAGIPVEVHPQVLQDARVSARRLPQYGLVLVNTIEGWRVIHAARACQVPSLWFIHEARHGQTMATVIPGTAQALGLADQVVFPAQATANLYPNWLKGNFSLIPYGLESVPVDAATPQPSGDAKLRVVNVASVEPRKGQDVLVQGLLTLAPTVLAQLEVLLIGRIFFPEFHTPLAQALAPWPELRFTGGLTHAETLAHLRNADVFVLASRDEVLPVSIMEAMAMGKAVISTDVGGVREMLVDGESGLIVPPEDPAALAAALLQLQQDPVLRARLGANARARFETHFTLQRYTEAFIALGQKHIQARLTRKSASALGQRENPGAAPTVYLPPSSSTFWGAASS